jgi:hypothetical protein
LLESPGAGGPSKDPIELAALHSYGYGRWSAPYWFIGPEPGKAKKEGDNLAERCRAWLRLCPDGPASGGVVDCFEHHELFGRRDLFEAINGAKRPPTQSTWRQIIRLLLAYQDKRCDNDAIADYQATKWGRKDGDTCVVELSALAMNRMSDEQKLREQFRDSRAAILRDKILNKRCEFVVIYGGGERLRPWWQLIACGAKDGNCFERKTIVPGWDADFSVRDGTVFVIAKHPVNPARKAPPNEYWTGIAQEIRSLRAALGDAK